MATVLIHTTVDVDQEVDVTAFMTNGGVYVRAGCLRSAPNATSYALRSKITTPSALARTSPRFHQPNPTTTRWIMTDYRELEDRLRAKPTFENAREAADAIKALREAYDEGFMLAHAQAHTIKALREENERLREALYVCMPYLRNRYPALSLTASKEGGVSPPTAPRDGESKIEAFRFIVRRA